MLFDFKRNRYKILEDQDNEDLVQLQHIKFATIREILSEHGDISYLPFGDIIVLLRAKPIRLCSLATMLKVASVQDGVYAWLSQVTAEQIYFLGTKILHRNREYFPYLAKLFERASVGKRKFWKKKRSPGVQSFTRLEGFVNGVVAYY